MIGGMKALFMRPVVERVNQGPFFRSKFALLVRAIAVLFALGVLLVIINMWRGGLSDAPGGTIFAGIVLQLFLAAGTFLVVQTAFVRAGDITSMLEGTYVVIPVAAVVLKLLGEVYAIMGIALAIGGTLAMWIKGAAPGAMFFHDVEVFLPTTAFFRAIDNAFLGGLAFLVTGIIAALLWLVFFYLLADILTVLGDVGTSARRRV
jgi:hypothetical protein